MIIRNKHYINNFIVLRFYLHALFLILILYLIAFSSLKSIRVNTMSKILYP